MGENCCCSEDIREAVCETCCLNFHLTLMQIIVITAMFRENKKKNFKYQKLGYTVWKSYKNDNTGIIAKVLADRGVGGLLLYTVQ